MTKKKKASRKKSRKAGKRTANIPEESLTDNLLDGVLYLPINKRAEDTDGANLPENLHEEAQILVNSRVAYNAIENKAKISENKIREYAISEWCNNFSKSGKRPASVRYKAGDYAFTFVQTKGVSLTNEKIIALRAEGLDISPHLETSHVIFDYSAIKKYGLEKEFKNFLKKMENSSGVEAFKEIVSNKVSLSGSFLENLFNFIKDNVPKVSENNQQKIFKVMKMIMKTLGFVTHFKSPHSPLSDVECFQSISKLEEKKD